MISEWTNYHQSVSISIVNESPTKATLNVFSSHAEKEVDNAAILKDVFFQLYTHTYYYSAPMQTNTNHCAFKVDTRSHRTIG